MLYFNKDDRFVETRIMRFGEANGISLGEYGKKRSEIFLPVPPNAPAFFPVGTVIDGFSVGPSRSGKPRINKEDGIISLILNCNGCASADTPGVVQGLVSAKYEIVARAQGAYGKTGNQGTWDEIVVKAKDGDIFRVIKSGGYSKMGPSTIYLVNGKNILHCKLPDVKKMFAAVGKELPFTLNEDCVDLEEWKKL